MQPTKYTWIDVITMVGAVIICGGIGIIGWLTHTTAMAISGGVLTLFPLFSLADMMHGSFRPTTRYERFTFRIFAQTLIIFFGGGVLVAAAYHTQIMWIPVMVVWLLLSAYSASKMQGRHAANATYQQRVGYHED